MELGTPHMACYAANGFYFQCDDENEHCCPSDVVSAPGSTPAGERKCCNWDEVCSAPGECMLAEFYNELHNPVD